MSHRVTAWLTRAPTPPLPAWPPLSVITPADWTVIDGNTYAAINGDLGTTHTPGANINIGGAGVWVGGPTLLGRGSTVSAVTFGSNDYFNIPPGHVGQTRTLATPCIGTRGTFGWNASLGRNASRSDVPGCRGCVPLKVIDGSVLTLAVLSYRVGSSHLPAHQLRFRLLQIAVDGTPTVIYAPGVSTGPGFVSPGASSAASYYAANATQYLSISTSARIDISRYRYYADIVDEYGASAVAGNQFQDVTLTFSGIMDTRPI